MEGTEKLTETLLPAKQRFRAEVIKPGYIHVYYPEVATEESIRDFYPGYIELLKQQPGLSCVIGDFSRTRKTSFQAGVEGVKWMPLSQPYLKRVAGFGIHPLLESMVNSILIMSGRLDIKMFKTRAEAEAWAFEDINR